MVQLVLHEFHRAAGARFGEISGQEVVTEYADWRAEYDALRQSAAVLDFSFRGRVCVLGADRQRFLHGQVTNNINELRPGQGCYAALVSAKGKLQSDLNIYCLDGEILLDFEPALTQRVTGRLEKYIIAEDVQIADVAGLYGLMTVQGPNAADILRRSTTPLPVPDKLYAITKTQDDIYVSRTPRLGSDGFDLFVPVDSFRKIAGQLAGAGCLCGWHAFETARIEAGIPRFGIDMNENNLAPEAIDTRAISYSKGCYIGQEVIARIRTYGQVAKSLHRLKLAPRATEPPAPGAKIYHNGKEAGYITSAVRSPALDTVIALGYIRREAVKAGGELAVESSQSNVTAQVFPVS